MAFPTKREKAFKARLAEAEDVIARLRDWLKVEDDLRNRGLDHNAGPHSAEEAARKALHDYDVAGLK